MGIEGIVGGHSWINPEPYSITARRKGSAPTQHLQMTLQSLSSDRFGLTIHRETKELPTYDLVAAKGGVNLAASKTPSRTATRTEVLVSARLFILY